jgi:hypothetical protein
MSWLRGLIESLTLANTESNLENDRCDVCGGRHIAGTHPGGPLKSTR